MGRPQGGVRAGKPVQKFGLQAQLDTAQYQGGDRVRTLAGWGWDMSDLPRHQFFLEILHNQKSDKLEWGE